VTRPRVPAHQADVLVWHGLMVVAMAAMLVPSLPTGYLRAGLVVFVVGSVWAVLRMARPRSRPDYLCLCTCCVAMVAMLVSVATVHDSSSDAMASMPGMAAMPVSSGSSTSALALPPVVTVPLVLALVAVVASGARRLGREPPAHLLGRGLELGTATAMAVMLALTL
jgi:hypothetical protein